MLSLIWPPGSPPSPFGHINDQVPAGIAYIRLSLHTLTSTVTVLTAEFGLDDDRAQGLERILNQSFTTRTELLPGGGHTLWDVDRQKAMAIEEWRTTLRHEAASWLTDRFPGTFYKLAHQQLPAIELLLTGQHRPWEPAAHSGKRDWTRMLGLGGEYGYWQCTSNPALRLQERQNDGPLSSRQRHRLVLAALEQEFLADAAGGMPEAIFMLDDPLGRLLARWSLTALLRELQEHVAGLQDAAEHASRDRSPQALADTQQQLLETGIDSRVVVNDIVRYAQDPWWKHGTLDFSEVLPPALDGKAQSAASLIESLREDQISNGPQVSRLETDLREILSTSAELNSAAENLRLQRTVVRLTVISVIVAVVAAAAAVIAIVIALRHPAGPASINTVHPNNSSTRASASPTPARTQHG